MMVCDRHTKLRSELHLLREKLNELIENVFSSRRSRIVYKNKAMGIPLNRTPTLLVFEVPGNVPQLESNFAKTSNGRWRVTLELNDATTDSRTVYLIWSFR